MFPILSSYTPCSTAEVYMARILLLCALMLFLTVPSFAWRNDQESANDEEFESLNLDSRAFEQKVQMKTLVGSQLQQSEEKVHAVERHLERHVEALTWRRRRRSRRRRRIAACDTKETRRVNLRIGFVGNSFTYYNNLPHLVQLFLGGSEEVHVEAVVHGGSNLNRTFHEGAKPSDKKYIGCDFTSRVQDLFKNEGVDVLVLQDNSRGPVKHLARGETTLKDDYVPLIKEQSKVPFIVLYQTYGYNAIGETFDNLTADIISGYSKYETLLRDSGLDVQVARVGENVEKVHSRAPEVWSRFYVEDGFHPSPQLTLLVNEARHKTHKYNLGSSNA